MSADLDQVLAKIQECQEAFDSKTKAFAPELVSSGYLVDTLHAVFNALLTEQTENWELEKKANNGGSMSDQKATNKILGRMDVCFEHFNRATGLFEKPATDAFIEQTLETAADALKTERAKHQALERRVQGL